MHQTPTAVQNDSIFYKFTYSCCSVRKVPNTYTTDWPFTFDPKSFIFIPAMVCYIYPSIRIRNCLEVSRCTEQPLPHNVDRRYTLFVVHCCMNHCWCTRPRICNNMNDLDASPTAVNSVPVCRPSTTPMPSLTPRMVIVHVPLYHPVVVFSCRPLPATTYIRRQRPTIYSPIATKTRLVEARIRRVTTPPTDHRGHRWQRQQRHTIVDDIGRYCRPRGWIAMEEDCKWGSFMRRFQCMARISRKPNGNTAQKVFTPSNVIVVLGST